MASRSGTFGGGLPSLHPFGGTSGFSQYDLSTAKQLADMKLYEAETAWGNGQLSDDAYLKALQDNIAATDPGTQDRISAQNKYDDAVYRIGRSKVEATNDLGALIAFDQSSLAKMTPDNLRYRDIKGTLDSELAQQRSKDYSKLVDNYNEGKSTTAALVSYVQGILSRLPADAPDRDQWRSTLTDLQDRQQNEADTQAFQDYQHERMKPAAFLAYLTKRRDSYFTGSPQWHEWQNKLEDATDQIHQQDLAKQDTAFFTEYNAGHRTDAQYVAYIRQRLAQMKPDDPNRIDWQNRLDTATFSIAEDKLRLDVAENKRPPSDLVAFYKTYQRTLTPNSPEWRTVQGKIDEASRADFSDQEDQIRFKVENRLLPISALVSFYQRRLNSLPEGTSDWRTAYGNLQNAKQAQQSNDLSILQFQADHPGVAVGSGLVGALPGTSYGAGSGSAAPSAAPAGAIGPAPAGSVSHAPASMEAVASSFIRAAGGVDSPEMRKAVEAWMYAEGVSSSASRNNPWNLHSNGGLPGQVGSVYVGPGDRNVAVFDSMDAGVAAAARNLNQNAYGYPAVLAALRANNPQGFLVAMQNSAWAESQYKGTPGQLIGVYQAHFGAPPPSSGGAAAGPVSIPSGASAGTVPGPGTDRPTTTQASPDKNSLVAYWQTRVTQAEQQYGRGSPEWRDAYDHLTSAQADAAKPDPQAIGPNTPGKAISPKATLETVVGQIAISPDSSPYAVANYQLNHDSIQNAYNRGDKVWLFYDPARPDATTYARNPDGTYVTDEQGKRVVIRGSGYYPVTAEAYARVTNVQANYYFSLAEQARANGQNTDAVQYTNKAIEATDSLRGLDNRLHSAALNTALNGDGNHGGILSSIDHAWATGDLASVVNLSTDALTLIQALHDDPSTDDTRKEQLDAKATKIATNALLPDPGTGNPGAIDDQASTWHIDPSGRKVYDNVVLAPGYHLIFKMDNGQKGFDVAAENGAPGEWEQSHVTLHVQFGDQVVTADQKINDTAPISPLLVATVDGKPKTFKMPSAARAVTFFDGSGNRQTMYSIDNGQTWIRPNGGIPPMLEVRGDLRTVVTNAGTYYVTGGAEFTNALELNEPGRTKVVMVADGAGNILQAPNADSIQWYGQDAATATAAQSPFNDQSLIALINSGATAPAIQQALAAAHDPAQFSAPELGAPGQRMTLSRSAPDGSVNMLPPDSHIDPNSLGKGVHDLLAPMLVTSGVGSEALQPSRAEATASLNFGTGMNRGTVQTPGRGGVPDTAASIAIPKSYGRFGLSIAAQLPPSTPPRIAGAGAGAVAAPPVKPIPPARPVQAVATVNLNPVKPVTPPTLRKVEEPKPIVPKRLPAVPKATPKPVKPLPAPKPTVANAHEAAPRPVAPKPVAPKPVPTPTPIKSGPMRQA